MGQVSKVAIFNEGHDLFGSLPIVSIEKWCLRARILEWPIGLEDFPNICIENIGGWYDVLASFMNPLWRDIPEFLVGKLRILCGTPCINSCFILLVRNKNSIPQFTNKLISKAMASRNVEHVEDMERILQDMTSDLAVLSFWCFRNISKNFHPQVQHLHHR